MTSRHQITISLLLLSVLIMAVFVYWPGLEGPYLFDDRSNLEPINNYGGIDNVEALERFILEAPGFPGRPLSLLSFVINDQYWPLDVFRVKFTNLMLHLLVGLIGFLFVRKLLVLLDFSRVSANYVSLVVVAIFLLHPLNVSTVLYAIQRMAQLSALSVLVGLYLFVSFLSISKRENDLARELPACIYGWCAGLLLALFSVIGILFKENAFLIFPLAWLLMYFLPKGIADGIPYRSVWKSIFLFAPVAMFLCYFVYYVAGNLEATATYRGYTASERTITQIGVVFDYIKQIASPSPRGWGLYYDDYPIVSDFLASAKSIFALGIHVLLIGSAVFLAKRFPVYAFGIFFFYIAHSLEVIHISLELYFEHRNYLPMLGLILAIVELARRSIDLVRNRAIIIMMLLFSVISLEVLLTYQRASLWGDSGYLAKVWADENPTSSRSQAEYISYAFSEGDLEASLEYSVRASTNIPNDLSLKLTRLLVSCFMELPRDSELIDGISTIAKTSVFENASYIRLEYLIELARDGSCETINLDDIELVFDGLALNERFHSRDSLISLFYYYRSMLYEAKRDLSQTIESIDKAYSYENNLLYLAKKASWLASAGLMEEAWKVQSELEANHRTHFVSSDSELPIIRNTRMELKAYEAYWSSSR
ncbi:hypothetical protein [Marinobacter sp. SS21]|uniref:hypothetical protein n=1 Tax=Marinobacter sp. SS21 TaxID=2979460 RepID=UPI00232B8CF0|nr:hypothetical protein [Marinobacter sp. SS21]MDC0661783.1 hypothetical protein [Marinobacter sp. SS21]